MAISVTKLRNSCLDVIRRVEATGQSVAITRHGRTVARLTAAVSPAPEASAMPWERLRALGGRLVAGPGESVIRDEELEALR